MYEQIKAKAQLNEMDYRHNLAWITQWIINTEREFPKDLVVKIADGHQTIKSIVVFCFRPHPFAPMGKYANPVFLYQDYSSFKKEVHGTYRTYCKLILSYRERFKEKIIFWDEQDRILLKKFERIKEQQAA